MPTCKDCLHYGICVFHLKGDENQKCPHYIADVVPKSEVEEILDKFAEDVKLVFYKEFDEIIPSIMADRIDELKKEYLPGTNNGYIVKDSEHRCMFCQEIVPQGIDVCPKCEKERG